MNGKNAVPQCTSRYCPVNSSINTEACDPPVQESKLKLAPVVNPEKRRIAADQSLLTRNRELRRQMDEQRTLQMEKSYRATIVTGPQEAVKMRILLMLGKFQTLGIEYSFLSEYFESCLKKMDQSNYDVSTIKEALVFDREDLKSSATCFTNAIANLKKLKTINFGPVSDLADGLSVVLRDLQ